MLKFSKILLSFLSSILLLIANDDLSSNKKAIEPYLKVVDFLQDQFPSIELNAGHDLSLINLKYFLSQIRNIKEVSIGHALMCDTFEFRLEQTLNKYLSLAHN